MAKKGEFGEPVVLDVDGFDVKLSSPDRVYFSERGETKLDLATYYLSVAPGIVNALREIGTETAPAPLITAALEYGYRDLMRA